MRRRIQPYLWLFAAAIMASGPLFSQQDPQFSQYMFNHLAINPAYAGSRDAMSFVATHRSQWVGFSGAPHSQALAFHTPLKNNKLGVGANIVNDNIGPSNMFGGFASIAYKLQLGKGKLAFGLKGGVYSYSMNWDEIELRDRTDPYNTYQGQVGTALPSFDFGMMYSTNKFFAGLAITHLNRPGISFSKAVADSLSSIGSLVGHGTLTIGKAFVLNEKWVLRPSLLFKTAGQVSTMADINASVVYDNKVWFGLALRTRYGFIALTRFNITEKLALGYSFDLGLTDLNTSGGVGGSHEIYLSYDLPLKKRKVLSPRYF